MLGEQDFILEANSFSVVVYTTTMTGGITHLVFKFGSEELRDKLLAPFDTRHHYKGSYLRSNIITNLEPNCFYIPLKGTDSKLYVDLTDDTSCQFHKLLAHELTLDCADCSGNKDEDGSQPTLTFLLEPQQPTIFTFYTKEHNTNKDSFQKALLSDDIFGDNGFIVIGSKREFKVIMNGLLDGRYYHVAQVGRRAPVEAVQPETPPEQENGTAPEGYNLQPGAKAEAEALPTYEQRRPQA